jgi:GNAT superfamily N-acetyltransferase
MVPVTIRRAVPADTAELCRLLRGFEAYLDALAPAEAVTIDDARRARFVELAFVPDPVYHVLVADTGADLAGHLAYGWSAWFDDMAPMLMIVDLFVDADHRGRGIGRALVAEAQRLAAARGCQRLLWTVWRENRAAIAFYERLGARFVQEERLMTLPISGSAFKS